MHQTRIDCRTDCHNNNNKDKGESFGCVHLSPLCFIGMRLYVVGFSISYLSRCLAIILLTHFVEIPYVFPISRCNIPQVYIT